MSTISNERLEKLSEYDCADRYEVMSMATELLALRKERERAEPVAWQFKSVNGDWLSVDKSGMEQAVREGCEVRSLYAAPPAPVVPDRNRVRAEHAEWSRATFGKVGPIGPLKHLAKEALESAAAPGDMSEWADMQFLLWDAQRCAGITDEQITQAMTDKLEVNKARKWPEPKDGEPRLHIKEQPAPVVQCVPLGDSPYDVPCSMPSNLRELIAEEIGILFSDDDAQSVWNVCRRAAMLNQSRPAAETDTTSQQFESLAGKAVGDSEGFECTPVADLYELLTKCGECYDYTTSAKVAADWIKEGYSAREYVKLDRLQEALIFSAPEPCK